MVKKVVVEIEDELAKFLMEWFHTDNIGEAIKELIDEGSVLMGFTLTGFGEDLKVEEVEARCQ